MVTVAEAWVEASVRGKRMTLGTVEEGEEWMTGPAAVLRNITLLLSSLTDIRDYGVPQLPKAAYARPDGQVVAPVLPANGWDGLLFQGFSAEVWMDPSVKLDELQDHQASFYKRTAPKGHVALVLGAGNHSSIGPMDALYKLFVEGQVVVLKMNPVNESVGPFIDQAFAALSEEVSSKSSMGASPKVTTSASMCSSRRSTSPAPTRPTMQSSTGLETKVRDASWRMTHSTTRGSLASSAT